MKLDRLGRNTQHVLTVVDDLTSRGIGFRSLTEGLHPEGAMGKAMLTMMAAFAELERDTMVERTRAGLAAAAANGRKGGRPREVDNAAAKARQLRDKASRPATSRRCWASPAPPRTGTSTRTPPPESAESQGVLGNLCSLRPRGWPGEYPTATTKATAERNPSDGHDTCRSSAVHQGCRRLEACRFRRDGREVAAMFVQGSVTYDEEEATFIAVTEDGHTVGELFVDDTVSYDENTDAFVIRTVH